MGLMSKCRQCSYRGTERAWRCPECGNQHIECAVSTTNDALVSGHHVNLLSLTLSCLSVLSAFLLIAQAHRASELERNRILETIRVAGLWSNSAGFIVTLSQERAYAERELGLARASVDASQDALDSFDRANYTWMARIARPYVGTSLYGVCPWLLLAGLVATTWTFGIMVVLAHGWSRDRVSKSTIAILIGSILWCMCLLSGGLWNAVT